MSKFDKSLLDVPSDTILHFLAPFLDAPSLLALSASCHHHYDIFRENNLLNRKLWRNLCIDRWRTVSFSDVYLVEDDQKTVNESKNGKLKIEPVTDDKNRNPWHQEYRRRLIDDNLIWEQVKEINSIKTPEERWETNCADLASRGMNAVDVVKRRRNSIHWFDENIPDMIVDTLIRNHICFQFRCMAGSGGGPDEYAIFTNDNNSKDKHPPLEYGAVLISKFFVPHMYYGDGIEGESSFVEKELNSLAENLLSRLEKRLGGEFQIARDSQNYPVQEVLEEMQYFFQSGENPFKGNINNYYAIENSMIHQILRSRLGIPITLAVIYSAIVRRAVGITLNPMGLPGHFMLSVTAVNQRTGRNEYLFVDAFDGGKIVTLEQVQRMITTNYQIPWSSRFLIPVSNTEVWHRMCRNIMNCPEISKSDREAVGVLRALGFNEIHLNSEMIPLLQRLLCRGIASMW